MSAFACKSTITGSCLSNFCFFDNVVHTVGIYTMLLYGACSVDNLKPWVSCISNDHVDEICAVAS
jgi:hypothetical protein